MKGKGKRSLILFVVLVLGLAAPQRSEAFIFINEILADPESGLAGDANNDGTRHSSADEFIEIRNSGINSVNLSGWEIADAVSTRHVFLQGTFLNPNAYIVVFGGGLPNLQVDWQIASSGSLGLNNGGDIVSLLDCLVRADPEKRPKQCADICSLIEHILVQLADTKLKP